MSETHLQDGTQNNLFNLYGYHEVIRWDRVNEGGGLPFKRLVQYGKNNLEVLWVQINTSEGKI